MTRKRKRDEEHLIDSVIEASELGQTPTTTSKPTSKAATEVPEGGQIETVPGSESSSPKMEVEEQTQTDETTKPEEQEVEIQLCAEVSSVSLDEREQDGPDSRKGEQDDSVVEEVMEIDDFPPASPMRVDRQVHIEDHTEEPTSHGTVEPSAIGTEDTGPNTPVVEMEDSFDDGTVNAEAFYATAKTLPRTYDKRRPRVSAPAKMEGGSEGGDLGGNIEPVPLQT